MVVVRNPTSGKSFRARVEGKGKVVVGASAGEEP
jgi:flagella basal body P-ring formation protein FlgA